VASEPPGASPRRTPGGLPLSGRTKGIALGLAASIAWGTVFTCGRYLTGMRGVDPLLVAAGRFALTSLALLGYVLLAGQGRRLLESLQEAPRFLLLGLVGVVGLGIFVFTSTQYTYSINGVLLMNSNGIFIAVLAFMVGEKVPASRYVGLAVGLLGCLWVAASWGRGLSLSGRNDLLGCALALAGAVSWALYTLLGKQPAQRWGGLIATTAAMCFGSAVMCLIVVARRTELTTTPTELLVVAYMALIPTAFGFVCWYAAMEYVPANLIGPLQYVAPVLGILLGWLLLHEPVRLGFVLGAVLVFLGVWIATRPSAERK
jgi:O-acetylserine/cysteine efflux transporter